MDKKIFFILFAGLVLRLINLNQSLWLDEATSIIVARDYSSSEILTKFSPGDFHPPLYYLILKVWMNLVGSSEIAARSLSVLFGLTTILFIYVLGKKLFTHTVGLLAALLLATAPLHIYYSQEVRMYAMETLLAVAVVYFLIKKNFLGLTVASALLLYTDYLPAFLLLSMLIYVIVYDKRYLPQILRWVGAVTVLYIAWLPTFLEQLQSGAEVKQNAALWWNTLGKTNLKELALVPVKFVIGRISSYDKVFYGTSVAFASVPFAFAFYKSFLNFSKTKVLWFWLLGPLFLAAIFGVLLSGFSYFRLLFILPAFYMLAAYGALSIKEDKLKNLIVGSLILVNLIASGIYLFNNRFHREDWRSAVSYIENNSSANSGVIFVSKNQRDTYHYYAESVPSFGPEGFELGFNQLFLMRYVQPIFDPKDELRVKIEDKGYTKVSEKDFNGVVVWEYRL